MARLGLPAPQDLQDPRDPEDRPGPLARKASRGLTVTLGPKAPRASRASEVCVCYCCCEEFYGCCMYASCCTCAGATRVRGACLCPKHALSAPTRKACAPHV
jgi:hypothetical protein